MVLRAEDMEYCCMLNRRLEGVWLACCAPNNMRSHRCENDVDTVLCLVSTVRYSGWSRDLRKISHFYHTGNNHPPNQKDWMRSPRQRKHASKRKTRDAMNTTTSFQLGKRVVTMLTIQWGEEFDESQHQRRFTVFVRILIISQARTASV